LNDFEEELYILPMGENRKSVFGHLIGFLQSLIQTYEKPIEITIKPYKFKRTDLQNRYLHGWIFRNQLMKKMNDNGMTVKCPDGTEIPWDVDKLKEFFKSDFIVEEIIEIEHWGIYGKSYKEQVHPSQWNTTDFWKYCERISWYAATLWFIEIEEPVGGKWETIYRELQG